MQIAEAQELLRQVQFSVIILRTAGIAQILLGVLWVLPETGTLLMVIILHKSLRKLMLIALAMDNQIMFVAQVIDNR